ncbi:hypothetical protein C7E12_23270, partial [Stenotrophomonas maltophilia]
MKEEASGQAHADLQTARHFGTVGAVADKRWQQLQARIEGRGQWPGARRPADRKALRHGGRGC